MTDKLQATASASDDPTIEGLEQLNKLSKSIHDLGEEIKTQYIKSTTVEEVNAVDHLSDEFQNLQLQMGNAMTKIFKDSGANLEIFQKDIDKTILKLRQIVQVMDRINIVLDAATEIAAIAAGLGKL